MSASLFSEAPLMAVLVRIEADGTVFWSDSLVSFESRPSMAGGWLLSVSACYADPLLTELVGRKPSLWARLRGVEPKRLRIDAWSCVVEGGAVRGYRRTTVPDVTVVDSGEKEGRPAFTVRLDSFASVSEADEPELPSYVYGVEKEAV